MLRIMQLEEIENALLMLPAIIDRQRSGNPEFGDHAIAWLERLEKVLIEIRSFQAGQVAAIRGGLAAVDVRRSPDTTEFRGRATRTRLRNAAAVQALHQAADLAGTVLAENRQRVTDAER